MLVRGQAVVPPVGPLQELAEAHVLGGGGEPLLVDAHLLQRRAVVGLEVDLAGALDDLVGEVDVVHQVLGAGHDLPVAGGPDDDVVDPVGDGVLGALPHHPDAVEPGRQLLGLVVDRGGVAGDSAVPVGRVDHEVLVDRPLEVHPVQLVVRLPAEPHPGLVQTLGDALAGARGEGHRGERRVRAAGEQLEPPCVLALRGDETGGFEAAVLGRGPSEELRPVLGADPVRPREDEEDVADHPLEEQGPHRLQVGAPVEELEEPLVLVEDGEVLAPGRPHGVALPALPVVDADVVQARDALRGQHRGVDEQGVLVDAVGEDEPVVGVEVPPVEAVPHHREHAEVLGTFQNAEHVGAGRAEHVARRAPLDLAPPVGAGVVDEQHIRVPGNGQALGHRLERALGEGVVAVEEEDVVAAGLGGADVARVADAAVLLQVDGHDATVAGGVLVDDPAAGVRGAVVHGDDLEVGEGLPEDRVEALAQVALHLVDGDDDADAGRVGRSGLGHGVSSCGLPITAPGGRRDVRGGIAGHLVCPESGG